jgi:hypothetical protein
MDFDHRPDERKIDNVADLIRRGVAVPKINAEIAKCDVVCACCHRLRTKARGYGAARIVAETPTVAAQIEMWEQ